MEIIDENPDNNDTMKNIAELLFENAASIHQDNYIVIVRDGKTYDHLIQIKNLYGAALQKLLIFPGDWHTLANYQPVMNTKVLNPLRLMLTWYKHTSIIL